MADPVPGRAGIISPALRDAAPMSGLPAFVQALCNPDAHGGHAVALVETHISWVLLAGEFAYKIKKPVDFGFLDFSTLARRRFFCEEELRLNRRFAPALYLGLTVVAGSPEKPTLDGPGEILDYAVKMRRFDDAALGERLFEAGGLTPECIDRLAEDLAEFHAQAERALGDDRLGAPETALAAALHNFPPIRATLEAMGDFGFGRSERLEDRLKPGLRTCLEDRLKHVLSEAEGPGLRTSLAEDLHRLDELQAWTLREFERIRKTLAARKRKGFVRECHGDLHLGNLALLEGRLRPFDCIEFNEELRWIDILSETAFLFADLEARGRADLAWRFLNRWLAVAGDYAGLEVLGFYRVYRALVRAKIACLSMRGADDGKRARLLTQFRRYFDYAERATATARPMLAIAHGFSGSGKSRLVLRLCERLPAIRVASDIERKRLAGFAAQDSTHSGPENGIYAPDFTRRTYARLLELARTLLQAGFSVILDATYLRAEWRDACRDLAETLGAAFFILAMRAPEALLNERIRARLARGGDPSEADEDVLTRQIAEAEPLDETEMAFALPIDASREIDPDKLAAAMRTNAFR
jgi:aminoglycoside phosphotransferase family enzyme/predicted kinase